MDREPLSDGRIGRLIELALMEDVGLGDVTSEACIAHDRLGHGVFLAKADGVIAGLAVAEIVFSTCDQSITLASSLLDGDRCNAGQTVAVVDGDVRALLRAERTALNFLQRMSGIATETARYVAAVGGTRARITDTRKTAPGLRVLDKMAVRFGGGVNHRFGLDDMILIKDNHIVAAGGVRSALRQVRVYLKTGTHPLRVEIETRNLAEVREALEEGGADRIMLDNFPLDRMREAVALVGGRCEVEASGGITLKTVRAVAETGVDLISVGALTHSVRALDLSLELLPGPPAHA